MTAYVFDAYGTLFDLRSAFAPIHDRLGPQAAAALDRWRTLQLDYSWQSGLSGVHVDFRTLTRRAFIDALHVVGSPDPALADTLTDGFDRVAPYPDARPGLDALKARGDRAIILSNGTPDMLQAATRHAGLETLLDALLSVESVGIFKPAPQVYALAERFYDVPRQDIVFVSSNYWDVLGAQTYGFTVVWLDRGNGFWPASAPRPARVIATLAELSV